MKVLIAFYKGDGNFIDKLIRWWTSSKYSHVELVVGDMWYSTSPRDLAVRAKNIVPKEEHWDYVEVDIDVGRLQVLFNETEGAGYDWLGIVLSQILPLSIDSRKRWFCSEWCAEALGLRDSNKYSPQDLYEYVTRGWLR